MEAATVATPTEAPKAAAEQTVDDLFRWSDYVHVGVGATECEHALDGTCRDRHHFHAWVCLPNSFQIRDITDKATAAKARKLRDLKDAGDPAKNREPSDGFVMLEMALDELREDDARDELIAGIAARNVDDALSEVLETMTGEDEWQHHAQDAEEYQRLVAEGPEQRDEAAFTQLESLLNDFSAEFARRIEERRERENRALANVPIDELIGMERKARRENIATEAFYHAYYTWAIFVGTREPQSPEAEGYPQKLKWDSLAKMRMAPPEVVRDLRILIRDLEQRVTEAGRGGAAGNS